MALQDPLTGAFSHSRDRFRRGGETFLHCRGQTLEVAGRNQPAVLAMFNQFGDAGDERA